MARTTRTTLGPKFNEGARLAWMRLRERGWGATDLRARLKGRDGENPPGVGVVDRLLYGDSLPGVDLAAQLEKVLEIPVAAWTQRPTRAFVLEAVKHARSLRTSA